MTYSPKETSGCPCSFWSLLYSRCPATLWPKISVTKKSPSQTMERPFSRSRRRISFAPRLKTVQSARIVQESARSAAGGPRDPDRHAGEQPDARRLRVEPEARAGVEAEARAG